jgi:hypothetical protein
MAAALDRDKIEEIVLADPFFTREIKEITMESVVKDFRKREGGGEEEEIVGIKRKIKER